MVSEPRFPKVYGFLRKLLRVFKNPLQLLRVFKNPLPPEAVGSSSFGFCHSSAAFEGTWCMAGSVFPRGGFTLTPNAPSRLWDRS